MNMIEEKEYLSSEVAHQWKIYHYFIEFVSVKKPSILFQTVSAVYCTSERLRSIAQVHGALCEVALNVSKTFGINIASH